MENEVKKSNKGLYAIITILCIAVLGLGGFIVYDKFIKEDKEKSNISDNQTSKDNTDSKLVETTLSNDDPKVKDLANKVIGVFTNSILFGDYFEYNNYFYKKDKVILKDESLKFKLSLAAAKMEIKSLENDDNIIYYIEENDLKDTYYSLFGKDSNYERTDIMVDNCPNSLSWSNENNRYEKVVPKTGGCGGTSFGGVYVKLGYAKQKKNSNTDIIDLYEYFISLNPEKGVYSDYNNTNLITTFTNYDNNKIIDEVVNEYEDKVGIYKYSFVKDSDGNYVFTSVEKVR